MKDRLFRRELHRRLLGTAIPGEPDARDRAWRVVRAAWHDRPSAPMRARGRRAALALVLVGLLLAVGLSPAGARVGELIGDAFEGGGDPRPALMSLPAPGELLVTSGEGAWRVREDGSQRLLGDYEEASWSPSGLFAVTAAENSLTAVDSNGEVRWSLAQREELSDPRWAPSGFRVAYRSGGSLRLVAGDGTGDRALRAGVAPVAPSWKPLEPDALERSPSGEGTHLLTFATDGGVIRTVDVDAGRERWRTALRSGRAPRQLGWLPGQGAGAAPDRSLLVALTSRGLETVYPDGTPGFAWEFPPATAGEEMAASSGGEVAVIRHDDGAEDGQSELVVFDARSPGSGERRLLSGPGHFSGLAWSPDGRWLVVGWEEADQWLFLRTGRREGDAETIPVEGVSRQFDPGAADAAEFPTIEEWCCVSGEAGRP